MTLNMKPTSTCSELARPGQVEQWARNFARFIEQKSELMTEFCENKKQK
jgi:hypothetical protein